MEMAIDLEKLRQLISLVERNSLEELIFEEEGVEVAIKAEKRVAQPWPALSPMVGLPFETPAPGPVVPAPSALPALPVSLAEKDSLLPIVAPLVGVFYRSPAPDDPPFVEEGDWIEVGQVVGTIEAMKIFNDLHAEVSGRVVRILVENEQLVTQGETLMLLDPEGLKEGGYG
jgi:acetyl-CoA carboxylase biotin carboxyl carrier protein